MLDPAFGYAPLLPGPPGGGLPPPLARERYRVLWTASVAGRLVQRGWAPASLYAERAAQVAAAFPGPGPALDRLCARLFEGPRPTHAELGRLATAPAGLEALR